MGHPYRASDLRARAFPQATPPAARRQIRALHLLRVDQSRRVRRSRDGKNQRESGRPSCDSVIENAKCLELKSSLSRLQNTSQVDLSRIESSLFNPLI